MPEVAPISSAGAFIEALEEPLDTPITPENQQKANGVTGGEAAPAQAPDSEKTAKLFQSLTATIPLAVEDEDPREFEDPV